MICKVIQSALAFLAALSAYFKGGSADRIRKDSDDAAKKMQKAGRDAADKFDRSGGVPDEQDPNLRD